MSARGAAADRARPRATPAHPPWLTPLPRPRRWADRCVRGRRHDRPPRIGTDAGVARRRAAAAAGLDRPPLDRDDRAGPDARGRLGRRRRVAPRTAGRRAVRRRPPLDRRRLPRLPVRLQRRGEPLHALHRRISPHRRLPHPARPAGLVLALPDPGSGRAPPLPGGERGHAGRGHLPRPHPNPSIQAR